MHEGKPAWTNALKKETLYIDSSNLFYILDRSADVIVNLQNVREKNFMALQHASKLNKARMGKLSTRSRSVVMGYETILSGRERMGSANGELGRIDVT